MDGANTSSSSSLTAAQTGRWTYDVFVSFRGKDTRNNFVDHLYAALDQAGVHTFKDDKKLIKGKPITPELAKAIEESMVAVVVFSRNYANSCWCLEELVKIIECRDLMGQTVLPVFYDVAPSEVRNQDGRFLNAFESHKLNLIGNMEISNRWRGALVTAANLVGCNVPQTASGHEAECIKQIVRNCLKYTEIQPADNLIGMESRMRHVKSLLGKRSGNVCVIGIWGMGGIGKTTISRAVYRRISYEFDGSSFLNSVREIGSDETGLKSLQEKLLSDILMQEHFKVKDCYDGRCQIQKRMSSKKVLVVLDDVDNLKQLEFLVGTHEWFGPGTRIIITTRDEHLLSYAHEKYAPQLLNKTEATEFFCRYAFKENIPPKDYEKLSSVVVSYTGHLPLALKVLGSHFFDRNLGFWQSALNVLTKIPHKDINEILKLSYNGPSDFEKKILLHIACFFKGWRRDYVTKVLDCCGFEAVSGITVLIEKSLLTVSNGYLHMHDLIQQMGQCIDSECYPHTMAWISKDIKEVMKTSARLKTVEAIWEAEHDDDSDRLAFCSAKVFKRMQKLRLLQIKGRFTTNEPAYFPEEIKWLCWSNYPFKSMRITRGSLTPFRKKRGSMANLVGLELQFGKLKNLHIQKKVIFTNLKFMDLCGCIVTNSPDVSWVPNLERLILSRCWQLVEVHQSVLFHEKIIYLDLSSCERLKILPPYIRMKSLETLLLKNCRNLEKFPEVNMEMSRLSLLHIDGCVKMTLPFSIRHLSGLTILNMEIHPMFGKLMLEFEQDSLIMDIRKNNFRLLASTCLSSLRILGLKHNQISEADFPSDLNNFWPFLKELNLSENRFTRLPTCISQLSYLKYLNLRNCIYLEELQELPSLIQVLVANGCRALQKIGDFSNKYIWLFKISLFGCPELEKDLEIHSHLSHLLLKSFVQKCAAVNHQLSITVPGTSIPNWFSNQQLGNKIALNLSQNGPITKMIGLAMCCRICRQSGDDGFLKIKFKASCDVKMIKRPASTYGDTGDVLWIGYLSIDILENVCHSFESEDLIIFDSYNDIEECGVCVVYRDDIKGMTRTESRIPDYDELKRINHTSEINENLQHGGWSKPTFSFKTENFGDDNTIRIHH